MTWRLSQLLLEKEKVLLIDIDRELRCGTDHINNGRQTVRFLMP